MAIFLIHAYILYTIVEVRVSGRVHAYRPSGAKLIFYDLRGEGTKVQIMANASRYNGSEDDFLEDTKKLKRGDIIGVIGHPGIKKSLEVYLVVRRVHPTQ